MNQDLPSDQHNIEIHENRRSWEEKVVLRSVYADFYKRILLQMCASPEGCTNLELGSGMGNVKQFVPDCVTSDIFPNPWLDRVENAYRLTSASSSVANLILFDVWHHLEYPANALAEAWRVLMPGGRLIILDPAMSLTGCLVYGLFHHEPLNFEVKFPAEPVEINDPCSLPYFAAQSSAHRIFCKQENLELIEQWKMESIQQITSFAYLASGGFRGRQLYPTALLPAMNALDRVLGYCPQLFSARLLVVLSKP